MEKAIRKKYICRPPRKGCGKKREWDSDWGILEFLGWTLWEEENVEGKLLNEVHEPGPLCPLRGSLVLAAGIGA